MADKDIIKVDAELRGRGLPCANNIIWHPTQDIQTNATHTERSPNNYKFMNLHVDAAMSQPCVNKMQVYNPATDYKLPVMHGTTSETTLTINKNHFATSQTAGVIRTVQSEVTNMPVVNNRYNINLSRAYAMKSKTILHYYDKYRVEPDVDLELFLKYDTHLDVYDTPTNLCENGYLFMELQHCEYCKKSGPYEGYAMHILLAHGRTWFGEIYEDKLI